jgi:hypothetical protein
MGQIHDNFISSWPTRMLIIEEPDKMLTDLRNSKGSREFSATSMEILVSGVHSEGFLNLVFACCTYGHLDKVQDTAMSLLHSSRNPHFLQRNHNPYACHATA